MSEVKHTPGPWTQSWDYKPIGGDSKRVLAHAVGPQHSCIGVPIGDDDHRFLQPDKVTMDRVFADARLIAAAPRLLDLLEKARLKLLSSDLLRHDIDAALAEVTGITSGDR